MSDSQIPGTGLSYAELLDTARQDPARVAWHQLDQAADAFGLTTLAANGPWARSKTVDELVADLSETLPEDVTLTEVMVETAAMLARTYSDTYVLRRLRTPGDPAGSPVWVVMESFDDEVAAFGARADYMASAGRLAVVVRVRTEACPDLVDHISR